MQEKVFQSILLFFECHPADSYKHLVPSVLREVSGRNPDGIKPSVEHIVDLLSVASCFQVNIQQKEMILSEVFVFI
jgi:hypothetical protein